MNKKHVNNLIEKLTDAEHAYYVLNKPIMSDGEYDKLFNELKEIELENPDLVSSFSPTQRVTGTPENVFEQVSHKQRMYSLDNSENVVDIEKWIEKIEKLTYGRIKACGGSGVCLYIAPGGSRAPIGTPWDPNKPPEPKTSIFLRFFKGWSQKP